jgi:hypothetical protein
MKATPSPQNAPVKAASPTPPTQNPPSPQNTPVNSASPTPPTQNPTPPAQNPPPPKEPIIILADSEEKNKMFEDMVNHMKKEGYITKKN